MKIQELESPIIAAHRGLSSLFPENTLPAFEAALNLGCQMIELDVGVTKDNVFVIFHDETLERTTAGSGRISEKEYKEICGLDAASKISNGKIRSKIPLLSDVLDLVKDRCALNIEIKGEVYKKGEDSGSHEAFIVEQVIERQMKDQIIFSSFNHEILKRLRRLSKELNLGILTSGEPRPPVSLTKELNAFSWHPGHVNLSRKKIEKYKDLTGKKIIPYTVNNPKKAAKLLNAGVDGFFTDYPQNFI